MSFPRAQLWEIEDWVASCFMHIRFHMHTKYVTADHAPQAQPQEKAMHKLHRHGMAESNATLTARHLACRLRSSGFLQNEFYRTNCFSLHTRASSRRLGIFALFALFPLLQVLIE